MPHRQFLLLPDEMMQQPRHALAPRVGGNDPVTYGLYTLTSPPSPSREKQTGIQGFAIWLAEVVTYISHAYASMELQTHDWVALITKRQLAFGERQTPGTRGEDARAHIPLLLLLPPTRCERHTEVRKNWFSFNHTVSVALPDISRTPGPSDIRQRTLEMIVTRGCSNSDLMGESKRRGGRRTQYNNIQAVCIRREPADRKTGSSRVVLQVAPVPAQWETGMGVVGVIVAGELRFSRAIASMKDLHGCVRQRALACGVKGGDDNGRGLGSPRRSDQTEKRHYAGVLPGLPSRDRRGIWGWPVPSRPDQTRPDGRYAVPHDWYIIGIDP
ncbi:hypothetical protein BC827DRAFT_1156080 [Russula dissimulans]|nr:hypothetical protein BC827DRAFT_1156080 [Russula dissimulans]